MSKIMELAGDVAHQRSINIVTHGVNDDTVIIEGTLADDRMNDYYLITGEKRPAGAIHHLVLRLLLNIPNMLIEDVEVEMKAVPREECHEIRDAILQIKGLSITKGFTLKVKKMLGDVKGCTHLVTLITAMAPAAMQGVWSYKSQKPVTEKPGKNDMQRLLRMQETLKNTCYVWRDDGPRYKRLLRVIDKMNEE